MKKLRNVIVFPSYLESSKAKEKHLDNLLFIFRSIYVFAVLTILRISIIEQVKYFALVLSTLGIAAAAALYFSNKTIKKYDDIEKI